jgi:hypothetical protein
MVDGGVQKVLQEEKEIKGRSCHMDVSTKTTHIHGIHILPNPAVISSSRNIAEMISLA